MDEAVKTKDDFPLRLTVHHVAEIMGVCDKTAYNIVRTRDFPRVVYGRKSMINRDVFFEWWENKCREKAGLPAPSVMVSSATT